MHINTQSKDCTSRTTTLCSHPTWVHINQAVCNTCTQLLFSKQWTNCTEPFSEELTFVLFGYWKFNLLRGDFLTCVLLGFYLLPKMTVLYITLLAFTWQCTDTFYFSGGKTLSKISYFWQCFQYLNACTHWEWGQIIMVCCDLWQQQHFSYQKTKKRQMNDSVSYSSTLYEKNMRNDL